MAQEIQARLPGLSIAQKLFAALYYLFNKHKFKRIERPHFISPFTTIPNKQNCDLQAGFMLRAYSQIHGEFTCGRNVRFGQCCSVFGKVEIGNNVMIAPNAVLAGGSHGIECCDTPMMFQTCPEPKGIIIHDDVWIGANATILDGSEISPGVIIGAGAIVAGKVPENAIVLNDKATIKKTRK